MQLRPFASCCVFLLILAGGCANLVETRAITAFSEALEAQNLEGLKSTTSQRFADKSLRLSESIEDFAILKLPKGDVEVVEVEDVSDSEKRVTVEVGESKQKLRYRLLRDANTRKWVVDDVYIRRKKDGIASTRPVTELMDLVTTVREFLTAWSGGRQADMVEHSDPQLAALLTSLPRPWLARLAEQAIGDRAGESRVRPEAQMDEDVAVVRLPRKSGQMLISFRKIEDRWLISDLAVESRKDKEHIPSVKQFATALVTITKFLDAYSSADKKMLKEICADGFYNNSLEPADLSTVPLPSSEQAIDHYQIRMESSVVDFVVQRSSDVVKVSLQKIDGEDSETPVKYIVQDVTLYELDGREEKRLSALFLSHAMVDLVADALIDRELATLRVMTTADFRNKVWSRLDDRMFLNLPLPEIEAEKPRVLTTVFMGDATEITVNQGTRALVYVLQDQKGELLVDDVLIPVANRPSSLKKNLEALIPAYQFAEAWVAADIERLQRLSSNDLNGTVWHQTLEVPSIGSQPREYFTAPVTSLEFAEDRAVVGLGDDRFGARVLLVREGEDRRYVVDDVRLIAGPELSQRIEMKAAMRFEISRFRKPNEQAPIRRVSAASVVKPGPDREPAPVPKNADSSLEEVSLEPVVDPSAP